LVGALGELRQLRFSWFKKGQNQQTQLPATRRWVGRGWVCSGLALSHRSAPACPKVGTDPQPRRPPAPRPRLCLPTPGTGSPALAVPGRDFGDVRGDSGSCQRRGSGERAEGPGRLPPSPLPVTVTGRQPRQSWSRRWELSGGRAEQAAEGGCTHLPGPRGAPRGNPLPPMPRQGRTHCLGPSVPLHQHPPPFVAAERSDHGSSSPICFSRPVSVPQEQWAGVPGKERRQEMGQHRPAWALEPGHPWTRLVPFPTPPALPFGPLGCSQSP